MLATASLKTGIARVRVALEDNYVSLSELDGQLGDGDLGLTLLKAFRQMDEIAPSLDDDLGRALGRCAVEVTKVASSSFGTLLATALMAAGKRVKGATAVPWSDLSPMLDEALTAMMSRGKSQLGEKTVLDAVSSCAKAIHGIDDPSVQHAAATEAVAATMAEFRGRPCLAGRARIFGDKSVGMDDPGMAAFTLMLTAVGREG